MLMVMGDNVKTMMDFKVIFKVFMYDIHENNGNDKIADIEVYFVILFYFLIFMDIMISATFMVILRKLVYLSLYLSVFLLL